MREQVTARAAQFGITQKKITESQTVSGGLLVAGQTLNATEANQYQQLKSHLDDLLKQQENAKTPAEKLTKAVDLLIDEIAYTWFNRLAALRFMEVNGYIGRVLSSSDPNLVDPDILRDAYSIAEMEELPGLNLETLSQWRNFASREPNPDEYLYRRLLLAQCEGLAAGIPALFDKRKNYQALFLPGNLLNQDSIVRRFVKEIAEEDWQDIEIVGWLYQFYISERKDEVIGAKSKVEAKDIPAATQLFTPRWIVQYMVENSLGRLWLESHPESKLREKMPYFLESRGGEDGEKGGDISGYQSPLVNSVQISASTTKEPLLKILEEAEETSKKPLPNPLLVGEGTKTNNSNSPTLPLTPQELTVIDPACGSGHILVYAFDLLLEIYKEQGYLERDIPALILTHNLYGLDIDERAAQLASFAVLMKARAVNSRILRKPPALNIMAVRSTRGQVLPTVAELNPEDWQPLIEAFQDADNLGSLITIPDFDADKLRKQLDDLEISNPIFKASVIPLYGLISQAELLRNKYWVVVANPPYMGSGSFNEVLNKFAINNYHLSKGDLFAIFLERTIKLVIDNGLMSTINQHSWMFSVSYESLRKKILTENTIVNLIHLGIGVFQDLNSKIVQSVAFVLSKKFINFWKPCFINLTDSNNSYVKEIMFLEGLNIFNSINQEEFSKLPGNVISYWLNKQVISTFQNNQKLENFLISDGQTKTGNNDKFLRYLWEVKEESVKHEKWKFYSKGGSYRRWFGNLEYLINWSIKAREHYRKDKVARLTPEYLWNKEGITWSYVTSGNQSFRLLPDYAAFDSVGVAVFPQKTEYLLPIISLLNSCVGILYLNIAPTINTPNTQVTSIPVDLLNLQQVETELISTLINEAKKDWDNFETSWDFQNHPLLRYNTKNLSEAFTNWQNQTETAFR